MCEHRTLNPTSHVRAALVTTTDTASHHPPPHLQDWKSSMNSSDPCCASCFNHDGCPYPCMRTNHTPPAPPAPTPPVRIDDLSGEWTGTCTEGPCTFSLTVGKDRTSVQIANQNSTSSCWGAGAGSISSDGRQLRNIVCREEPSCPRNASGTITVHPTLRVVDHDYAYVVAGSSDGVVTTSH